MASISVGGFGGWRRGYNALCISRERSELKEGHSYIAVINPSAGRGKELSTILTSRWMRSSYSPYRSSANTVEDGVRGEIEDERVPSLPPGRKSFSCSGRDEPKP